MTLPDMLATAERAATDQSDVSRMRRRREGRCPTHGLEPEHWGMRGFVETGECYTILRCPHEGCDYEVMR